MESFVSDLSGSEFPVSEKISGHSISRQLLEFIRARNPQFSADKSLSLSELYQYRERYTSDYLVKEVGELSDLEKTVLDSVADRATLADKIDVDQERLLSVGQRIADKVASFGGSWTFIIAFGVFILGWIVMNAWWLAHKAYDPYPFILLNLILSCVASVQAPVIMMSQNRQEDKDRDRARQDYMVNLKSELEIRMLHEKLDHLIFHQQQQLLEIHKAQNALLDDIKRKLEQG